MLPVIAGAGSRRRCALRTVAGLALAWSPQWAPRLGQRLSGAGSGRRVTPQSAIPWDWGGVVALAAYVRWVERAGADGLLVRRPAASDVGAVAGAWAVSVAWSMLVEAHGIRDEGAGLNHLRALSGRQALALVATVSVTEELLYFAYPIERLTALSGSRSLACDAAVTMFVAPHMRYFGARWLLTEGPAVGVHLLLYQRRRSLLACMLFHALRDSAIWWGRPAPEAA